MKTLCPLSRPAAQRGVAAVEFAIVAIAFFTVLFGIVEFARMLYLINSMQEVTRHAAREATVRWIDDQAAAKALALFGGAELPYGAEVTSASITITYLRADDQPVTLYPADPGDNLSACGDALRADSCIYSVKVSIAGVKYQPMITLFGTILNVDLPTSTVTMHAESMGFSAF